MSEAPDYVIWINRIALDDGFVYDVVLGDTTLHAVTEMEAHDMADAIANSINIYSTSTAGVVCEE